MTLAVSQFVETCSETCGAISLGSRSDSLLVIESGQYVYHPFEEYNTRKRTRTRMSLHVHDRLEVVAI